MITKEYSNKGIHFKSHFNGQILPFNEWMKTDDSIYYQPLSILIDNGYAEDCGDGCLVPYENIYQLNDTEKIILGVPEYYNKDIFLRAEGMLNNPELHYNIIFLDHAPDGEVLPFERSSNIVTLKDEEYLLRESQYDFICAVENFNDAEKEKKTPEFNFRRFAIIKKLAQDANVHLDSYLANENVYAPEKIKIEIDRDDEGFTVSPSIETEDNKNFQKVFDRMRKTMNVYPVQKDNGERVRVVLKPEQKEGLELLKQSGGRRKTREEIQAIVEQPTEYFDPDCFELSDLYSDRVIEIGVYKPKFYPFVCPYKSCWITGATVETPENGTTKVTVETELELAKLENAINEAEENEKEVITFKGAEFAIQDAKLLVTLAKKQFNSPEEPIKDEQVKIEKKVLIIEENAEEVGYSVNESPIQKADKYILYRDTFLNYQFRLKEYQEEGVAWLQHMFKNNANGCLIADDMGLGKTLQILYFIDWHSRTFKDHNPYLIVAPVSLLENWESEYKRFFDLPRLNITRLSSHEVPRKYSKSTVEKMQKMDVILTSYESLRISQLNFCAVQFDIVALDEAQRIKTPGTMVTNAAKALKSKFRIAMTGTPVENTLLDLWCIMDFCVPGLLDNAKAFAEKYQNPLKNSDTDICALGNEIHEKLGIYFMRRLKKDAAKDLPMKHEIKECIEMPSIQEESYKREIEEYTSGVQPNMLLTIMGIREISEHPYLRDHSFPEHETQEIVETSARLLATINFLEKIKEKGDKVIIFAEHKETQKMLQKVCFEKFGIMAKVINGDTPSVNSHRYMNKMSRQQSIDDFQNTNGFNIIIMSPIAAGMGLNVTAANHVIHYSRHWNPAKESQATDRAYRIGQKKDVYVYYPMAVCQKFKSFDETLDELLSRKTSLATSTLFPTERVEVNREELGQMLFESTRI